jgi:uncharacterized membrane protein
MLVAGAVTLVALVCCYFPVLLVAGPLTCGLYACALGTLRGRPIGAETLWRGWPAVWNSMAACVAVILLSALPTILLYLPMFLFVAIFGDDGHHHAQHPPETWMVVAMFGVFALQMVGMMLALAWSLWLQTRTMFILPLIADRGLGFVDAWRTSWQTTRKGFWELLLLQFLAGLIGGIGAYACVIGLLFTMPIFFTVVATAYEDRLGMPPQ